MNEIEYRAWFYNRTAKLVPREPKGTGSDWVGEWQMGEVATIHLKKKNVRILTTTNHRGREEKSSCDIKIGDECILMQYTGKIDTTRNRKVFEGDIYFEEVEGDEGDTRNYCVVVWINELSRFALLNDFEYFDYKTMKFDIFMDDHFMHEDPSLPDLEKYHFAGTIHQNPELLQ